MVGATISHYRVLEKVGAGGMGVVYRAQDMRLKRYVALKFLPEEFVDNPRLRDRFRREAQAASALNHPNICTLYDIGEADGHLFMAMEFLDGFTLKDLVLTAPLELDRLVDVAIQVLDGLEAAHSQGIIHRDIKPANIFITASGRAKILDFGVAKISAITHAKVPTGGEETFAIDDSSDETSGAWALGTMPYMSPEQALGKPLDERSDLFSFGVTLYQMAAGQMPFQGDTTGMLFLAIVQSTPVPVITFNQNIPVELHRIIDKCLVKDLSGRYQNASEIRTELRKLAQAPRTSAAAGERAEAGEAAVASAGGAVVSPQAIPFSQPKSDSVRATSTNRLPRQWAAMAVLVAALLVAVGLYLKVHKKTALSDRDTIVLADVANSTGDAVFDDTLKMALMVGLNESPFLDVLPESKVAEILKLMTRGVNAKLTPEIAKDLCQRAGAKAFIVPSIASLGSEYVVGLRAERCDNGAPLAEQLTTATTKEEVLDALGHAAAKLREQMGEALTSVQKFDAPLEEATTPSLDALTAYSRGIYALSLEGERVAIPSFLQATQLDPKFALAYASLGTAYANLHETDLAKQNYQKAYDLRSRASAREQYVIAAYYYNDVTGDLEKSNETYLLYANAYPRAWVPRNNLAGNYAALGQWQNALAQVIKASKLNADSGIALGGLVEYYCRSDRYHEAKAAYDGAIGRGLDYSDLHYYRYAVAFVERDAAEMQRQAQWAVDKVGREDVLLSTQSDTEAFFGRLQKARDLSHHAIESAAVAGEDEAAARWELNEAIRDAEFGYPKEAKNHAAAALRLSSSRNTRVLAAIALARAGDVEQAGKLVDELHRQNPLNTKLNVYWLPAIRAAIELYRQNPAGAIEILKDAAPYESGVPSPLPGLGATMYPVYLRGYAYLALHQGSAAKAEFLKYRNHPGLTMNSVLAALAPLGIARADALQNNHEARTSYQDFLAQWKDADAGIPIYLQAKTEYNNAR